MVPLPLSLYLGVGAAMELFVFLPHVADARLSRRLDGLASTLVLPAAWSSVDLLIARLGRLSVAGALLLFARGILAG